MNSLILELNLYGELNSWKVALKAPEIYDINNFIGRYVIATSKKEEYTKNDGTAGVVYRIKSWTYSDLNDKMTTHSRSYRKQRC